MQAEDSTTQAKPAAAPTAAAEAHGRPKVTLHWLDSSRAQRMVWLLEECKGCDYDIKVYKRGKDQLAPAELKKAHALGKSPTITITSAERPEGFALAESGFEAEYLVDHFAPHLAPARWQPGKENKVGGETEQWLRYRYYVHYNEGSLMPLLVMAFVVEMMKTAPQPFFIKPITRAIAGRMETSFVNPNLQTHLAFLEEQLRTSPGGGDFLCGREVTAADILMSFPILALRSRIDAKTHPRIHAYATKMEQNEAYIRAVAKIEEVTGEKYKVV